MSGHDGEFTVCIITYESLMWFMIVADDYNEFDATVASIPDAMLEGMAILVALHANV